MAATARQEKHQNNPEQTTASSMKETAKIDPYHCNCFFVSNGKESRKFYLGLKRLGAYNQVLQEDHGQKWALTLVLDQFWQLHVKMMPDNHIECEVEPRIKFVEHQTIRSKPAHQELQQLLEYSKIDYGFVLPTPEPCNSRLLHTPNNSTDITQVMATAALMFIGIAITLALIYVISKRKET